jgi:hypothetical protein
MTKTTVRYLLAFMALGLGSGLVATGCGGASVADICDLVCTCNPCTDADRTECEKQGGDAQKAAENAGCGSAFDDALTCFYDNASCKDNSAADDACKAELKSFDTCTKGGGLFSVGDDCTRASSRLSSCLDVSSSGTSSGGTVKCEGATLCTAECVNAADCAAIKDAFSGMATSGSKSFIDCVNKCSASQ